MTYLDMNEVKWPVKLILCDSTPDDFIGTTYIKGLKNQFPHRMQLMVQFGAGPADAHINRNWVTAALGVICKEKFGSNFVLGSFGLHFAKKSDMMYAYMLVSSAD